MSLSRAKSLFLSSLFIAFMFFSNSTSAQVTETGVSVNVVPSIYGPNENITITLSSYSDNLDIVPITWTVSGKNISSGTGKKSFSLTSGAVGTQATVLARISLPEGVVQKTIIIKPNTTTLVWEALDSYVPPFYKGKALPGKDTRIKVVAMPELKAGSATIDPKSLVYSWKKDYSNDTEGSGYGKNFFTYINDFLENSDTVSVTAQTVSGAQSTTANINIASVEPQLTFYKKNEQLGILWGKSIENGHLIKDGETIVAAPYFISPKDIRRPDLAFRWFINDVLVTTQNLRKNQIPLRVQEGVSGESKLRLEIENINKIFESAEKEVEIQF